MEREGREEEKRRGRREGGEKMRGLVIGGMVIGLLLGCNNGMAELEKKSGFYESIANLSKGFLSVFTDLGDMVTDTFGIKAETTKSTIGQYFTKIETAMKAIKEKLNNEVAKNGNYAKVKEKVDEFIKTIGKIEEGAKTAAGGAKGDKKIGGATSSGQDAAPANKDSVNLIVNGIKTIVGVVLKKGEGDAGFDRTTAGADKNNVGKMLSGVKSTDGSEAHAAAASASIGAVSGVDILRAIANSDDAKNNTSAITAATDAAQIAASKKEVSGAALTAPGSQKDAVIAAGIALRAMAEDGEFAANANAKSADAVNGASSSAVNKTLSTLIIAIRNTVNSGLKTISDALASVNQGDMSAETSESGTTKK